MRSRAVFLDRDGVLNRSTVIDGVPHPPTSVADVEVLPGAAEACGLLHTAGLLLIVVTNQPDIARGSQTYAVVASINDTLRRRVGFDDLFMCPHDDKDQCACRKPKPGMLLAAAAAHDIDLGNSVMVGDRDRDIAAGRVAGCRTVFIDHGYGGHPRPPADLTVRSLREAVPWIMLKTVQKAAAR